MAITAVGYKGQSIQEAWAQTNDRELQFYKKVSAKAVKKDLMQQTEQKAQKERLEADLGFVPEVHGINRATYQLYDVSGTPEAGEKNQQTLRNFLKPENIHTYLNEIISGMLKNPTEMLLPTNQFEMLKAYEKYEDVLSKTYLYTDFNQLPLDPEVKAALMDRKTRLESYGNLNFVFKARGSKFCGQIPLNMSPEQWDKLANVTRIEEMAPKGEDGKEFKTYLSDECNYQLQKSVSLDPDFENNRIIRSHLKDDEEFDIEIQGENLGNMNFEKRRDKAAEFFKAQAEGKQPPEGITGVNIVHNPEKLRKLQEKAKNGVAKLDYYNLRNMLMAGISDSTFRVLPEKEIQKMRQDYLTGRKKPVSDAQKLEWLQAGMENLNHIAQRYGTPRKPLEEKMGKALAELMAQLEKGSRQTDIEFRLLSKEEQEEHLKENAPETKIKNVIHALDQAYLAAKEYSLVYGNASKNRRETVLYNISRQLADLAESMSKGYKKAMQYNINYEPEMPKTNFEIYTEAMVESLAQKKNKNFASLSENLENWNQVKEEYNRNNIAAPNGSPEQNTVITEEMKNVKAQLNKQTSKLVRSSLLHNVFQSKKWEEYETFVKGLQENPRSEDTKRQLEAYTDSVIAENSKKLDRKKALEDYNTPENKLLRAQLEKGIADLDKTGTTWRDHKQFKELKEAEHDLMNIRYALNPRHNINPGTFISSLSKDAKMDSETVSKIRDEIIAEDYQNYLALHSKNMQKEVEKLLKRNYGDRATCEDQIKSIYDNAWTEICNNNREQYTIAAMERMETKLLERFAIKAAAYAEYVGEFNMGKNQRQQNRATAASEIRDAAEKLAIDNRKIQEKGTPFYRQTGNRMRALLADEITRQKQKLKTQINLTEKSVEHGPQQKIK